MLELTPWPSEGFKVAGLFQHGAQIVESAAKQYPVLGCELSCGVPHGLLVGHAGVHPVGLHGGKDCREGVSSNIPTFCWNVRTDPLAQQWRFQQEVRFKASASFFTPFTPFPS